MTKQKKATDKKAATAPKARYPSAKAKSKPSTKLGQLEAMLRRPDGATIEQLSKSLNWQMHSIRGAMSGTLKKKQGLMVTSEKKEGGKRVYRIAA
jgi:hypothetical protein